MQRVFVRTPNNKRHIHDQEVKSILNVNDVGNDSNNVSDCNTTDGNNKGNNGNSNGNNNRIDCGNRNTNGRDKSHSNGKRNG